MEQKAQHTTVILSSANNLVISFGYPESQEPSSLRMKKRRFLGRRVEPDNENYALLNCPRPLKGCADGSPLAGGDLGIALDHSLNYQKIQLK